jgi:hypothetical protein
MPGKTSPQVLHFSISIGISLSKVEHDIYYRYANPGGTNKYWILGINQFICKALQNTKS